MTIAKTNLMMFINHNFKEMSRGGCADYKQSYGNMTLAEINACESKIAELISVQHTEVTYIPDGWQLDKTARNQRK